MKNFTRFLALMLAVLFAVGTVSVAANTYADAAESDYAEAIDAVSSLGIIEGVSSVNFQPSAKVNRWRFVVFAAKALTGVTDDATWLGGTNTTTFTDITGKTAPAAVSYAVSLDLIKGRSETVFDPNATITLAEATTIMVRALGYDYDVRYNTEMPDSWKWAYLSKAMELGVVDGLAPAALDPDHAVTREEAALIIYNTLFITRKNGSTVADKIWGGIDTPATSTRTQLVITSAKPGDAAATSLVTALAVHTKGYIKLNGFIDGKVDDSYTLYMTSDEFKDYTGLTAKDLVDKKYIGASVDVVFEGDEILEMTVNAPTVTTALANGQEFSGSVLTVGENSYETANADLYVAFVQDEYDNGYPVYREEGVPKMSRRGGIYYGVDGEEVVDTVGNKFFLDLDDNIVAEWVHDVNSVAYKGVIISGQYGKFASSAENTVTPVAGAQANVDGNYRYATDADLAKVAYIYEENKPSLIANETDLTGLKDVIGIGQFTTIAFDDDGDGEADRIIVNGSDYSEIIGRVLNNKVEYLLQGADGVPAWANLTNVAANGNLGQKVRADGVEYSTYKALKAADDADYFVALKPAANAVTIEITEWIPYEYGMVVNLAEVVNPTTNYATTATIGIKDKTTGVSNNYFVDIAPAKNADVTNPDANAAAWKYYAGKVAVGIADDVAYLAVEAGDQNTQDKTLADRSVVVSQWVEFVHRNVKAIKTVKDHKVTATETKDMILYIAKDTEQKLTNMVYVSSNLTDAYNATFTLLDTTKGEIVTLNNVNLVDTVFNKFSLNWVYNLRTNLAIDNDVTNFAYTKEGVKFDDYAIPELWADSVDNVAAVIEHFELTADTAVDANKTYYEKTVRGSLNAQELQDQGTVDNFFSVPVYMDDGNGNFVEIAKANAVEGVYYTFAAVQPDANTLATCYEHVDAVAPVDGYKANLLYLNFTKDNVGDFYTVAPGTAVDWEESMRAKNVTEYTLLEDIVYKKDAQEYQFVKDTQYTAQQYATIFSKANNTGNKLTYSTTFGGKYTTAKEFTFADESTNFQTVYNHVDELNVYTIASKELTGEGGLHYWFSTGIEYSIVNKTPVLAYDANQQAVYKTFDVVWGDLSAANQKQFTKVDNSFDIYTRTGDGDVTVTNGNAQTVIPANSQKQFKLGSDNKLYEYTAHQDAQVVYASAAGTQFDANTTYYVLNNADYEEVQNPDANDIDTYYIQENIPEVAANLTLIGTLTADQAKKFTKTIAGYKALVTFTSAGKDGANLSDKFEGVSYNSAAGTQFDANTTYYVLNNDVYEEVQNPDANDIDTYYTQADASKYLYNGQKLTIADLTDAQLAIISGKTTASAWGDELHGIPVTASSEVDYTTGTGANQTHSYRYNYTVAADATGNVSFIKASGINYDGKAFTGLLLIDGQTVGATGDDTVFVIVEPQNVKVSADKKSYTQAQGYTFTTYTASEFQKMQVSAHQYITDCADGKTATYVIIYGNVVPGDTGTVTLTTLTNATVTGLELNVEKKVNVGEVSYNVAANDGFPILTVKVDGTKVNVVDGKFTFTVKKDTKHTVSIEATAEPKEQGTVKVTANANTASVKVGSKDMTNKTDTFDVDEYEVKVTPKNGYPIVSAKVNNEIVDVVDNAFTITVAKDQQTTVEVICSDVLYVYLDTVFNSTVVINNDNKQVWSWTSAIDAGREIFSTNKLNGAVYETFIWDPTQQVDEHIYDEKGIYTVKYNPDPNGTGVYQLIAKVATTTDEMTALFTGAAGNGKVSTGAYYGSEGGNNILFFSFNVDTTNNKISYADRTSMMYSNFIFVSYTEADGYKVVDQTKFNTNQVNKEDPTASNFLPWNTGDVSYAETKWLAGNTATSLELSEVDGTNAHPNIDVDTITFKYTLGADNKIIVFVNTTTDAALTSTK